MATALNARQLKFVEEYLRTDNATQAYIKAGYKARGKSAGNNASRLLEHAGIKEAVAAARDAARLKAVEKHNLTAEWVLERMRKEAIFRGTGASHSARVKAIELLGRQFGLFPARMEHSGPKGGPIPVNLASLPDDDLSALEAILTRASLSPAADAGAGAGGEGPA